MRIWDLGLWGRVWGRSLDPDWGRRRSGLGSAFAGGGDETGLGGPGGETEAPEEERGRGLAGHSRVAAA